jgi:hypothetical protein
MDGLRRDTTHTVVALDVVVDKIILRPDVGG